MLRVVYRARYLLATSKLAKVVPTAATQGGETLKLLHVCMCHDKYKWHVMYVLQMIYKEKQQW